MNTFRDSHFAELKPITAQPCFHGLITKEIWNVFFPEDSCDKKPLMNSWERFRKKPLT